MAVFANGQICRLLPQLSIPWAASRGIQTTSVKCLLKRRAGRYKPSKFNTTQLTYEMAKGSDKIGVDKAWNSWNTSNLKDEGHKSESLVEDAFIRQFMKGTWPGLIDSEVIIKRRHNLVNIAFLLSLDIDKIKVYFLIGYTEELLSCLFKCPVKLDIQTVAKRSDVIFKKI